MPSRIFSNCFYIALASILLVVACRSVKGTKENCSEDEKTCQGNMVNICLDGKWTVWDDCSSLNMTCTNFGGSAQCTESMIAVEKENDSTSGDIDIYTDTDTDPYIYTDADADTDADIDTESDKVISETTTNICNCMGRLFNPESGISWIKANCIDNIHEDCMSCYDQKIGGGNCSDLDFEENVIAMAECAGQCPDPITAPSNKEQCMDLFSNSIIETTQTGGTNDLFADCICSKCFDSFHDCLSNQSCAASVACIIAQRGTSIEDLINQPDPSIEDESDPTFKGCEKVITMNSLAEDDSLDRITAFVGCINFTQNCIGYFNPL